MARLSRAGLLAAAALALASIGCNSLPASCDRDLEDNPPIQFKGGRVENGIYRTSDFNGPLLDFPGGIRYLIFHQLGQEPTWWDAYLSFSQHGEDDGTVAQAAGNQVEMEAIDDQSILLTNGSCAQYWLLVVAGTGASPPVP